MPGWLVPVASSVAVGSKAMVATGAACTALQVRSQLGSLQRQRRSSSARLAVTSTWGWPGSSVKHGSVSPTLPSTAPAAAQALGTAASDPQGRA